jgi:Bacteriocin-protection, YdeI or OmpD-Associated/Domain of unknown function (DUF1905)
MNHSRNGDQKPKERRAASRRRSPGTGHRFEARLESAGGGGHLVRVPQRIVEALGGGARIPVNATFNGIPYRGSIFRMGGPPFIGVVKAIIAQARVAVGDKLDVVVESDAGIRTIVPPPDLEKALAKNATARAAWAKLSYTRQRELVQALEAAKKPETRERRLQKAIDELALFAKQ